MKVKQSILVCMTVAVVFGCSVASVKADDNYPPPWFALRGSDTNTTYQNWTFSTDANPSQPDAGLYNVHGTPYATITGTGNTWYQFWDGENGVWALSGSSSSMDLNIPNTPFDESKQKHIWTQISWEPNGDNAPPVVMVAGIPTTAQFSNPSGYGSWVDSVYETTLAYNPQSEDIIITGSYYLGEVVVDTICPEPSSLALLAVGAVSLLACASRKRRLAA